jgi:hypothetical protein
MPNATCASLLQVWHARIIRLDDVGDPVPGIDSLYEHTRPILVSYTETRPDRVRIEQADGGGENCAVYNGPPRAADSVALSMDLCKLDAELIEMLLGGTVITNGAYGTIGYLAADESDINVNGIALETWSIAWNGESRLTYLGAPAWYRHIFPKTTWQLGEVSMSGDTFSTIPLTGVGEKNPAIGTGLPTDPFPADVSDRVYAWALDDAIPTGACGYQEIAA